MFFNIRKLSKTPPADVITIKIYKICYLIVTHKELLKFNRKEEKKPLNSRRKKVDSKVHSTNFQSSTVNTLNRTFFIHNTTLFDKIKVQAQITPLDIPSGISTSPNMMAFLNKAFHSWGTAYLVKVIVIFDISWLTQINMKLVIITLSTG